MYIYDIFVFCLRLGFVEILKASNVFLSVNTRNGYRRRAPCRHRGWCWRQPQKAAHVVGSWGNRSCCGRSARERPLVLLNWVQSITGGKGRREFNMWSNIFLCDQHISTINMWFVCVHVLVVVLVLVAVVVALNPFVRCRGLEGWGPRHRGHRQGLSWMYRWQPCNAYAATTAKSWYSVSGFLLLLFAFWLRRCRPATSTHKEATTKTYTRRHPPKSYPTHRGPRRGDTIPSLLPPSPQKVWPGGYMCCLERCPATGASDLVRLGRNQATPRRTAGAVQPFLGANVLWRMDWKMGWWDWCEYVLFWGGSLEFFGLESMHWMSADSSFALDWTILLLNQLNSINWLTH